MNYKETLEFLFSSLPMYQRTGQAAYKANLDNTLALDKHLSHPHRKFKTIHIAGTNGKGSVSHMLASVLQSAGYKTGLYTSPHLKDFRERIRINGEMITKQAVIQFVENNLGIIKELQPSFFEMTVGMAFDYFAENNAEFAVIETGMGGRLDSTNIIKPLISVITNIGLDHTQFLGHTHAAIAAEKAGIIKEGIPVVISERQKETIPIFTEIALQRKSELYFTQDQYITEYSLLNANRKQVLHIHHLSTNRNLEIITDLLGFYQKKNVPTVLTVTEILKNMGIQISEHALFNGISRVKSNTGLRGRWEELAYNPLIICDTAHNAEGIREVMEQLNQIPFKDLRFVFGLVADKDPEPVLRLLPKKAIYYFTKADIPRAMEAHKLKLTALNYGLKGESYPNVKTALRKAKKAANPEDLIFIGGSSFVVAEALDQGGGEC